MKALSIPLERMKALFRYDPETGDLFRLGWLSRGGNFIPFNPPQKTCCLNVYGYVQVRLHGETILGHRLAWFLFHGEWPDVIDHINGDRADNRITNLRNISQAENTQNVRAPKAHNTSGFLGVSFDRQRQKFVAAVTIDGKRKVVGRFDTPERAHQAYLERKRELHSAATI